MKAYKKLIDRQVNRKYLTAQVSLNIPGCVQLSQCSFWLKTHLTLQRDANWLHQISILIRPLFIIDKISTLLNGFNHCKEINGTFSMTYFQDKVYYK